MKKIFRKNNKLTVILRSEADFDKCEVEYTECTSEHVLCKSSTECDLHKQIKTRSKNFELSIIQDSEASSGSYQLLNNTPSRSDSEHTQSSQTNNVGWAYLPNITKLAQTAALTLAMSFFIAAPAMAQAPVPTLDNLHNQEIINPATQDKDEQGNPIEGTGTVYPESAYTLTEIENADPENLPQNAITLYNKNEDGTVTPKYYTVSLKQTIYGEGSSEKTFNIIIPNKQNVTIKYNYSTDNKHTNINNTGDLSDKTVTGNFINNYGADGPAIYNNGSSAVIGEIKSNFIGNSAFGLGGAIYNSGKIGDITGDFVDNSVTGDGGGIYNINGEIGDITGTYISNSVGGSGGAIYNKGGIINSITGNFIANYTTYSGAVYNINGQVGRITGNFISNTANKGAAVAGYGNSIIGDITGDFIGNSVKTEGGAIYNQGEIGNITGDFIGNYASGNSSVAGGAIYNFSAEIGNITGDFIGNYVSGSSYASGGAIYNIASSSPQARIGNITGDFIGNYAQGSSSAYGGAIYNQSGTIGDITGDFIGNYASGNSTVSGGAIYNIYGTIGDITGNFIGNYAQGSSSAYGGAIVNDGKIGKLDDDGNLVGGIYGSFINNYAKTESDSQLALGGAVYTFNDMNFIADNQINYFSGNYTQDYRGKINNAIFVKTSASSSPTIKLQAQNSGVIVFNDQIDGGVSKKNSQTGKYEIDRTNAYNLALDGDNTGAIYLNNEVINANISIDNTNVYVNEGTNLAQSRSLAVNSGVLNINHLANQTINFEKFSNAGSINLASVDVDLAKESMGRITADEYGDSTGKINVQGLNLLSDATKDTTSIQFADKQIAGSVSYTGVSPVAYSPIWKYDVSYAQNPEDNLGYFTFVRGAASSGNASSAFNPSVLASPVATQAGAYTTQLQTFNYAFQHADTFMNIPYIERLAIINEGKYALSPTGDATDVGTYSPLMIKQHDPGFWVKPYASFENVPLKNGPKVSNINYGTLIGYDSPLKSISNGFERVLTGYIGYNGASQRYSGVDAYQNGGLLGSTATFYKGNFFNATTLSVGATAGDASTMYGSENYTMLLAGLGNKTGYNFEFFDGGMILQPSMLISYTFVNTFDYTNGAGVRIESDPMHAIQLAPGIKLIGNTKNGWQPYIGVSMVWNLLDESKVTADSVRLPEMSIKPYVQYGVGLQKRVNDKFLAFGQAMIHNGGRNGVSLSAGLRWKIGRE